MTSKNVVTLFCGCGGLDYGFKKAGFNIVSANDFWKPAIETYNNNFKHKAICDDITKEETKQTILKEIGDKHIHCIIGGPPCQAYSMSGHRDPLDKRGHLFKDYIEMVKRIQPDFIVMENVKGILSMRQQKEILDKPHELKMKKYYDLLKTKKELQQLKKTKGGYSSEIRKITKEIKSIDINDCMELVVNKIVQKFKSIGYNVMFKTLNSANFGVPQKRERVIFIGTRIKGVDLETLYPEITHTEDGVGGKKWVSVKDAISYLSVGDDKEDKSNNHIISKHSPEMIEKIKNTKIGTSLYKTYSDAFFKCDPDKPSRTVKENHGGVFLHYEKNRCMTPRELAELQSFPSDFIFKGSKSKILKQIGNAVPPKLGEAIGKQLLKVI